MLQDIPKNMPEHVRMGLENIVKSNPNIKIKTEIKSQENTMFNDPPYCECDEIYIARVDKNPFPMVYLRGGIVRLDDGKVFVFNIDTDACGDISFYHAAEDYGITAIPEKKANGRILQIDRKPLSRAGNCKEHQYHYFVHPNPPLK